MKTKPIDFVYWCLWFLVLATALVQSMFYAHNFGNLLDQCRSCTAVDTEQCVEVTDAGQ